MDNIGGAERVGLTLARELGADIYSTNIDKHKIMKMGFDEIDPISIGNIPAEAPFRQQMAIRRFRRLDLGRKYDFYIIDGDWAMSGAVNNKPNMWYVHAPIREIWDLYRYTREKTVPWFARNAFDLWVRYNRYLNRKYLRHVNRIVCNSENTKMRVAKYLKRGAVVINPPVDTGKFHFGRTGEYWLSVNRLITHKRVDLQMRAFEQMPDERLVVVGSYEKSRHFRRYAGYVKGIKPSNAEILHWVGFDDLVELYANCKGFITTSKDEDFGLTPVEAMASGKPVIAPNEGGYRESVVDGVTGRLIDDINVMKIVGAVREVGENPGGFRKACLKRARKYDIKRFISKIKTEIGKV